MQDGKLLSLLTKEASAPEAAQLMTISADGSAPSPSSVSAARTVGLASRKVVKNPFFCFRVCALLYCTRLAHDS